MYSSSTQLDSAVFQLTPTRTRFDLVIIVNGKKEKIASGLLNPFLSHLKVAQDQIAKGGYSIVLEPEHGSNAAWFMKGTVERFVRFVSTPEILERVYTIESEISQIEEAIAIQGNNSIGVSISSVEEKQIKKVESTEGRRTRQDTNEEKAVVLYEPDAQLPEANGSIKSEESSKVQLLKVLETRKSLLQKEQGMAFARAVAAGFDIDYIPALLSFAECFKASRLMDACTKFVALWKRNHENGQWLEIQAAEVMPSRLDFSAMNGSGIILSNMATTAHTELDSENIGNANSVEGQPTPGQQDNIIQGQFPHHVYPWPVHSPPGTFPVFQPYPVQGIPYYQSYPGNSPVMQPVWPPMEDPRPNADQNMGHRRHSMDNRNSNTESENWDEANVERDGPWTGEQRKKGSRSGSQNSGTVVIRNINYISKTKRSSGSGSYSDSASETEEGDYTHGSVKTSRRGNSKESKKLNSSDTEEAECGKDAEGHWQAFQNYLLRDVDEDRHATDQDQFELEKMDHVRRKKHVAVNDPLGFSERGMHGGSIDMHSIGKGSTRMTTSFRDDLLLSRRAGLSGNDRSVNDVQSSEIDGRRNGYMRSANDDFISLKQQSQSGNLHHSLDMEAVNGQGYSNRNLERKLFHDTDDDSYIVEYRPIQVNSAGNIERNAIDLDSEFPIVQRNEEKFSNYQSDELSLMPERGAEKGSVSYDPALDYEMMAQAGGSGSKIKKSKEVLASAKPGSKVLDKEQKSKLTPNNSDKKKTVGPIRRGKTNKLSPLDEARARAERLRNYKADLQKMKREKEEEEIRRLEALKMERQRRIAARSSSVATKSPVSSQLSKKQFPTKLSPSSHKGLSKFSDSEPGPSSPLQRSSIRNASVGSSDSSKASKTSRLNTGIHSAKNKLRGPSLPESKQEKGDGITNTKASMARIRRLSEPKMSSVRQTTPVKTHGTRTISKSKAADETQIKKISAIVNHDRSKTAALPELKMKTPKGSDIVQNKSSIKEKTQKLNVNKSSTNSEDTFIKKNETGISSNDDGNDNPVIEKTVVMLEYEKPYTPNINDHMSEEKTGIPERQYENKKVMEKTGTMSSYVAVCALASPVGLNTVDKGNFENPSNLQPVSAEVKMNNTRKEPLKSSSICMAEETHHAPVAQVPPPEDRCRRNSEHAKASSTSSESASIGMETCRAHLLDSRYPMLERIPEVVEKPQVKESPKGLRRLLKFGRKNQSSPTSGPNMESDNASIGGSDAHKIGSNGSSNEVQTMKNLISRDETPTTSTTPQKSSRPFSLFSPFRNKSNEKKIMMA